MLIAASLFLAGLFSCKLTRNIAAGYLERHQDSAALWSRRDFPCVPDSVVVGIPVHFRDTTYLAGDNVPCPAGAARVQCPPQFIIKDSIHVRDTAYLLDSAALKILYSELALREAQNVKLTGQVATLTNSLAQEKNKSKNRLIWIIALAGIMGAGTAGWIIAKFNLL